MRKSISFEINHLQYLDESAKPANDLPEFAKDTDKLVELYDRMQFLRAMDKRAVGLQRIGKMRTYPAALGQEAVGIGAGLALKDTDVLVPYYRGTGMMLSHGIKPHEILLYWGGDERGADYKDPIAAQDFPVAVPIATQILHAAGVATAIKLRGEKRAVMTEIGEGGTSEGEFYEALNVAGVWNLPFVCIVNNNQWAISVPSENQTKAESYAQKAIAAGMDTLQVDGNDIIAVHDASVKAMEKARNGGGPTLIEAICYRLCDHTTADDASRYHDQKVHDKAWEVEPVKRLEDYLKSLGVLDDKAIEAMAKDNKANVEKEVEMYFDILNNQPQPPEAMFDYLYAEVPEKTKPQREEAIRRGAK
ncbi:MAG: pyruvate dehydrogenase (acetyl-transferring) E1 component subunit alpha [Sphingomonadales bacterium]|nr:pyruvate dehydrogenase (acetyl-transferring) E1 component subunit alpha [Sphingomonadales bacterium]